MVQHNKFPQKLTIIEKRRMQRLRVMEKKKLPKEMPQRKLEEAKNLKEEVRPTPRKTKFGRKATKDYESSCRSDEEMDLRTILIGIFPISLKCFTLSLTLPYFFKSKEIEENLVEVEKEHPRAQENHGQRVITIDPL